MKKSIKLAIMLLIGTQLSALDFNSATDVKIRDNIAYENFKQQPFTGIGKIKVNRKKECNMIIATFKNGLLNGAMERWSCDGNLLTKETRIGGKNIDHFESWDTKDGKKDQDVYYNMQGKISRGWIKRRFIDEYDLYPRDLHLCFSKNMTYKDGKKTGYEMYTKHGCMDKGKVAYYKADEFIGCRTCE